MAPNFVKKKKNLSAYQTLSESILATTRSLGWSTIGISYNSLSTISDCAWLLFDFSFKKKKRERERERGIRERKKGRGGERIPVENSGEMARIRSGNWIRMKMRPLAKWESLFGDVTSTKVNRTFQRDWRVDSASSNFLSMKLAERTRLESRSVRGGNDFRNATRCYPPCPNFLSHVFPLSNLTRFFSNIFSRNISFSIVGLSSRRFNL